MEGDFLDQLERRVKFVIDVILSEKRQYINKHVQNSLNNYFLENYCVLSLKRSLGIMSGRQVKLHILNKYINQTVFKHCSVSLGQNPPKKYYLLLLGFLEEHYVNGSISEYRQALLNIVNETDNQTTDYLKQRIEDAASMPLETDGSNFVESLLITTQHDNSKHLSSTKKEQKETNKIGDYLQPKEEKTSKLMAIQDVQRDNASKIFEDENSNDSDLSQQSKYDPKEGQEKPTSGKKMRDLQKNNKKLLKYSSNTNTNLDLLNDQLIDDEMREILKADISMKKDWVINQWKKMLALFVLHHSYFPDLEAVYEIWYDIFQSRIVEKGQQKKRRPEHIRQYKYEGLPYVTDSDVKIEERKALAVRERKKQIIEESNLLKKPKIPKRRQSKNAQEKISNEPWEPLHRRQQSNKKIQNSNHEQPKQISNEADKQIIQAQIEITEIDQINRNINKIEQENACNNDEADEINNRKSQNNNLNNQNNQTRTVTQNECKQEESNQSDLNQKQQEILEDSKEKQTIKKVVLIKNLFSNDKNNQQDSQRKLEEQYQTNSKQEEKGYEKRVSPNLPQQQKHDEMKDKVISFRADSISEQTKNPRSCSISHLIKTEDATIPFRQYQTHQGLVNPHHNENQSTQSHHESLQEQLQQPIHNGENNISANYPIKSEYFQNHQEPAESAIPERHSFQVSQENQQKQCFTMNIQQQQQQPLQTPQQHQSQQEKEKQPQLSAHNSFASSQQQLQPQPVYTPQRQQNTAAQYHSEQQVPQINQGVQLSQHQHGHNQMHQMMQVNHGQQQQQQPYNSDQQQFTLQDPNQQQSKSGMIVHSSQVCYQQFPPSQYSPVQPQQQQLNHPQQQIPNQQFQQQYPYFPQQASSQYPQQIPYYPQQLQQHQQYPMTAGPTPSIQYVPVPYFAQPPPIQFYPQQQMPIPYYPQQQMQQYFPQQPGVPYYPQPIIQYYHPEQIQQQQQQQQQQPQQTFGEPQMVQVAQYKYPSQQYPQQYNQQQQQLSQQNSLNDPSRQFNYPTQPNSNPNQFPVAASTSTLQPINSSLRNENKTTTNNQDFDITPSVSPYSTKI